MSALASEHPGYVLAFCALAMVVAGGIVIGAILLGRSLKVDVGVIHAELKPNGGSSFRDAMDKRFNSIEGRLDKLEAAPAPQATAILVAPTPPEAA